MSDRISVYSPKTVRRRLIKMGLIATTALSLYIGTPMLHEAYHSWSENRKLNALIQKGEIKEARELVQKSSITSKSKKQEALDNMAKQEKIKEFESIVGEFNYDGAKAYLDKLKAQNIFNESEMNNLYGRAENISPTRIIEEISKKKGKEKISGLEKIIEKTSDKESTTKLVKEYFAEYNSLIDKKLKAEQIDFEDLIKSLERFTFNANKMRAKNPSLQISSDEVQFIDKTFEYLYNSRLPNINSTVRKDDQVISKVALGNLKEKDSKGYFFDVTLDKLPIGTKGKVLGDLPTKEGNIEVSFDNGVTSKMKVTELERIPNLYDLARLSASVVKAYIVVNESGAKPNEINDLLLNRIGKCDKNSLDFFEYLSSQPEMKKDKELTRKVSSAGNRLVTEFYAKKQDYKTAFYIVSRLKGFEQGGQK